MATHFFHVSRERSMPGWLMAISVASLLSACGNPTPPPAGPPAGQGPGFPYSFTNDGGADASVPADTGPVDSARTDSAQADSAQADSAQADSAQVDSTLADTGAPDATSEQDTSTSADIAVDTGPVDTGETFSCGDGKCSPGVEDCKSCPADCDACPFCGDNTCTQGLEDCKSCPADCNVCPKFCGDGSCDKTKEDCQSCAADCGNCPTVCGNGKCEMPGESYAQCPKDCPPTGTCDPLTSNGCVNSQQCYPVSSKPVCANAGSSIDGAACQLNTQCAKGYLCVGSKCVRICDHTGANKLVGCPADHICDKLVYNGGKDVGWNLGSCIKIDNCNLTTEAGCPAAEMCAISANGKSCVKAGTAKSGATCKYANDCTKGLICIGKPGTCKPKCHLKGGSPKCAVGSCSLVTIQQPGKPAKPAPDDLGVCG